MPTKDNGPVATIQHTEDGQFVHYGFTEDGVFHPFSTERIGDYEERIEAAKDAES